MRLNIFRKQVVTSKDLLIYQNDFHRIQEKKVVKFGGVYVLWAWVMSMTAVTLATAVWLRLSCNGGGGGGSGVLVCYYTPGALLPRDLHPHLCTHLNFAFAQVENKQIKLTNEQRASLSEVVKLKASNRDLKILLSVGGAGGDHGFSDMIVDHKSRKIFIKSLKEILRNFTLDGVDLDWEFPGVHNDLNSVNRRERQHFSQLLREIRKEYMMEKRGYLLTVATAAPQTIVDAAYDVDQLNLYVDFVNIMTYDYHYFSKFTPFTGLNSPLYVRPSEQLYFATLNINYTVNMYLNKGLERDKVVVGIPAFGHSFTLVNPGNAAVGSPASGYGSLGSGGFVNYPDICTFMKKSNTSVVVSHEPAARVPYLHSDTEWVSYDTPESIVEKTRFIREMGLRGAMLYSLNADDYTGVCNRGEDGDIKFPLAKAARNSLMDNIMI